MLNRYRSFGYVRNQRGSQIVEYIFVFPLLWFLFIYGCDQFSIMYQKQKALAVSYEAGRFACVQPNYGLAVYMANKFAEKELEQALHFEHKQIELIVKGGWSKGNHVEARVSITFPLLGSGKSYTVEESYSMMIENGRNRG